MSTTPSRRAGRKRSRSPSSPRTSSVRPRLAASAQPLDCVNLAEPLTEESYEKLPLDQLFVVTDPTSGHHFCFSLTEFAQLLHTSPPRNPYTRQPFDAATLAAYQQRASHARPTANVRSPPRRMTDTARLQQVLIDIATEAPYLPITALMEMNREEVRQLGKTLRRDYGYSFTLPTASDPHTAFLETLQRTNENDRGVLGLILTAVVEAREPAQQNALSRLLDYFSD